MKYNNWCFINKMLKWSLGQEQSLFLFQKLPATDAAPADAPPADAPATEAPAAEAPSAEDAPIDETAAAWNSS